MKNTRLAAGGRGVNNSIKWVTVVEVIEDIKRLQQGEFLITTGFKLLEDKERMEIFHDLLKSNFLSGVAIYTSFYMERIPKTFIEIAERNNLPLIEIPTDINFSEITKAILEQIVNNQMHLLEQSEKIHRELTDLILNDQSLGEVTDRLAQLTSSEITIYNGAYDILYSADFHKSCAPNILYARNEQDKQNLLPHLDRSAKKKSKAVLSLADYRHTIYPILAKGTCFGWIVMAKKEEEWQELNDIAIERASTVYAMEFLKKAAIEETQLRIHSNLLDDIFNKNYVKKKLIIDRALKLNYDLSLNQAAFHLTFKHSEEFTSNKMDRLYHITEQMLIQKNKQHIMQRNFNSIIFLTNVVGEEVEEHYNHCISLAKELMNEWQYNYPKTEMMIGIGKVYCEIEQLGNSANEAQYAIELCSLINPKANIVHYTDLGMYDLLLEMKRNGIDLRSIYKENLNGLLQKSSKEIDLIETIEMYFKYNQSIQHTANELFIHRHTLRYRLNQIKERTGLDIKSSDDRFKLELSIMAYKLEKILDK